MYDRTEPSPQPLQWLLHSTHTFLKIRLFINVPLYLVSPPSSSLQRVHWLGLLDSQAGPNWSSTSLPCSTSPPKTPVPLQHHAQGLLNRHKKGCAVCKECINNQFSHSCSRMTRKPKCSNSFSVQLEVAS